MNRPVVAVAAVSLAAGAGVALLDDPEPATRADPPTASERLVQHVNRARARRHIRRVAYSLGLSRASAAWSRLLATPAVNLRHADAKLYRGEAVLWRTGKGTALAAFRQWMASPPHRAVLLDRGARRLGAGRARAHGRAYWTARTR